MTQLELDHEGRLTYVRDHSAAAAEKRDRRKRRLTGAHSSRSPDLDETQLQPAEPLWNWLATSDTRAAWTGTWPGSGRPLRVEAAALGGRPVAFMLIGPGGRPGACRKSAEARREGHGHGALRAGVSGSSQVRGFWPEESARRSRRSAGRGPAGVCMFSVLMALWLCQVHLVASLGPARRVPDRRVHRQLLRRAPLDDLCRAGAVRPATVAAGPRLLDERADGACPRSGRRTRRADRLGARRGVGADDSSGRPLLEAQRPRGLSGIDGSALRPSRDHWERPCRKHPTRSETCFSISSCCSCFEWSCGVNGGPRSGSRQSSWCLNALGSDHPWLGALIGFLYFGSGAFIVLRWGSCRS